MSYWTDPCGYYMQRFYQMQLSLLSKLGCVEQTNETITLHAILDPTIINIIGLPLPQAAVNLMDFVCTYHFRSQFHTIGRNENFQFEIRVTPPLWQPVFIQAIIMEVAGNTVEMRCKMTTLDKQGVLLMSCIQTKKIV